MDYWMLEGGLTYFIPNTNFSVGISGRSILGYQEVSEEVIQKISNIDGVVRVRKL
ncbi:hypothetical protein GF385_00420 [Candidatus Dependentiae bacterium]|nr:hypothetical protein [Candidatus Dependentiae bacterium]